MNKKFIWLIISCLMVAALVLASCGPEPVMEEKEAKVVTKEPEKKVEEVEEEPEKVGPQYGGTITIFDTRLPNGWDTRDSLQNRGYAEMTGDTPLHENWEIDRNLFSLNAAMGYYDEENEASWTGGLAESWEMPDNTTLILYIRKGVLWQSAAPVNGREFIAKDIELYYKGLLASPKLVGDAIVIYIDSVEATDKYTVVFKLKRPWVSVLKFIGLYRVGGYIIAPELWEKYGTLRDWRVHRGTGCGPWILEDVIPDSCVTFSRNPTYWEKDSYGNQLPYANNLRFLIIPDSTTQAAAIRAGLVDFGGDRIGGGMTNNVKVNLEKTNPEIQFVAFPGGNVFTIWPNQTIEPFGDVRVRQALSMGLNRQEINDAIFKGTATTFAWPAASTWPEPIFTPLEKLPENIREIYTYNPEKAKQLLAEAGYPTLKLSIEYCPGAVYQEAMELVKAYWAQIGVDVTSMVITPNWGGCMAKWIAGNYPALGIGNSQESPLGCANKMYRTTAHYNMGKFSDSKLDDLLSQAETEFDSTKRNEILGELYLHMAEQTHGISMPTPAYWSWCQPWIKGYQGETDYLAFPHIWIDSGLKKQLTGK